MNLSCDCEWDYFITMIDKEEIFNRACQKCGLHEISFFGYWLSLPSRNPQEDKDSVAYFSEKMTQEEFEGRTKDNEVVCREFNKINR